MPTIAHWTVDTYFFEGSELARRRSFASREEALRRAPLDFAHMKTRYAGHERSYTVVYPVIDTSTDEVFPTKLRYFRPGEVILLIAAGETIMRLSPAAPDQSEADWKRECEARIAKLNADAAARAEHASRQAAEVVTQMAIAIESKLPR